MTPGFLQLSGYGWFARLPDWSTVTDNSPATIDTAAFIVRRVVTIRALQDRVWETITDPALMIDWFGDTATLQALQPGAEGMIGWTADGDFPFRVQAVEAPRLFAFTWGRPGEEIAEHNSTLVTLTLAVVDGGTELTVVESGFDLLDGDVPAGMEDNAAGWDTELDELVDLLELQDSQ